MKFKELKKLDNKSLNDKMKEIRLELMKENAQVAIGTVPKNPGKIKLAKKTIARINTLLSKEEFEKQSRISQTPHKSALNADGKESYSKPSKENKKITGGRSQK